MNVQQNQILELADTTAKKNSNIPYDMREISVILTNENKIKATRPYWIMKYLFKPMEQLS